MDIATLVSQFTALAGVGALIALLVNILKTFNVVKDGQAPSASLFLNLAGVTALILLRVFRPDLDVAGLDATAAAIASAGVTLFGLFVQLWGSRLAHMAVAGAPVIGKSRSLELTGKA